MGMQKAENGKCPDGFRFIYGNVCIEESPELSLDSLLDSTVTSARSTSCESAVSALQALARSLDSSTNLVQNAIRSAKSLVSLPFDKMKNALNAILGELDEITGFLDEVMEIWTGLSANKVEAVKDALESLVTCPIMKATPLGQQIEALIKQLDTITDELFEESIKNLKSSLSRQAEGQLNAMKAGPLETLDNLDKKYREYLEALGLDDDLKKLRDLADCVEKACRLQNESADAYEKWKKAKGITSPAVLEEKLGATYSAAENKVTFALATGKGEVKQGAEETLSAYRKVAERLA